MSISEHYSIVRWYDGAAWVDVSAEVAGCTLAVTRASREIHTLSQFDPLLATGGRSIRLILTVVRETNAGFYRALLDADSSGAAVTLELYQPDMTTGSRKASGAFRIEFIAALASAAGSGATGLAQLTLRGARGFTQTSL